MKHREAVSILMLSPFYFRITLKRAAQADQKILHRDDNGTAFVITIVGNNNRIS